MSCLCVTSRADDVADALTGCRKALRGLDAGAYVTIEQRDGTWQIADAWLFADALTDADVKKIGAFPALRALEVQGHRFTDAGWKRLSTSTHVRRLWLRFHVGENTLKSIAGMRELEELELHNCEGARDRGLIPLRTLPKLRHLALICRLTDTSLESLKGLTTLEELEIRGPDAHITVKGIAALEALPNLRVLQLPEIGEEGLAALKDLPRLEDLTIETFSPWGDAADLSACRRLKTLNIGWVLRGPMPLRLPENLEWLHVPAGQPVNPRIHPLPKSLAHVELVYEFTCGAAPRPLCEWLRSVPRLREVTLIHTQDEDLNAIAGMKSLQKLVFSGSIRGEGMKTLRGLEQLESLTVNKCMRSASLDVLRDLRHLRELRLGVLASFPPQHLTVIGELQQVRVLFLHFLLNDPHKLCDRVLADVGKLVDLEELAISGDVSDDGLRSLVGLMRLRQLNLIGAAGYTDDALASLMRALPQLRVVKRRFDS